MTTSAPMNDNSDLAWTAARTLEEELIEEVAQTEADEATRCPTPAGERLAAFARELVAAGSAAGEAGLPLATAIAAVPRPSATDATRHSSVAIEVAGAGAAPSSSRDLDTSRTQRMSEAQRRLT